MLNVRRPSPALLVSIVALFVAASGAAWGASGPSQKGPTASTATKGKRGPRGPSDGYVKRLPAATTLTANTDTTVAQLFLSPGSKYIVTAATELGNNTGTANLASCTLLENFNPIGHGSAYLPGLFAFSQTITLTSATTGGNIKLTCNPDSMGQARNRVITAIKVGSLHTQ
jgi:hypothetical protein